MLHTTLKLTIPGNLADDVTSWLQNIYFLTANLISSFETGFDRVLKNAQRTFVDCFQSWMALHLPLGAAETFQGQL